MRTSRPVTVRPAAHATSGAWVVALLLAVSLVVPTAMAESGVFARADVDLTPELFSAGLIGEVHEGEDAAAFRAMIDEDHGDADGEVTTAEVDAYRAATKQDFNDRLGHPLAKGLVAKIQVNERPPLNVRVTDIRLSGNVTGAVDQTTTILRDIFAELEYIQVNNDRANVTFGDDFRKTFIGMEWGYATFTGSGDWAIDGETIVPEGTANPFWTGDGFNVTYEEMDDFSSGFEPLEFQLYNTTATPAKEKKDKDSPGMALPVVLLALVALAVSAARRR